MRYTRIIGLAIVLVLFSACGGGSSGGGSGNPRPPIADTPDLVNSDANYAVSFPAGVESSKVAADKLMPGVLSDSVLIIAEDFSLHGVTINTATADMTTYINSLTQTLVETNRVTESHGSYDWTMVDLIDPVTTRSTRHAFLSSGGTLYQIVMADNVTELQPILDEVLDTFEILE